MTATALACRFVGEQSPGAPRVWALALEQGLCHASPEAMRQRARSQVRAALRQRLAASFNLPEGVISLDDRRGARVRAQLAAGTPVPAGWATLGLSVGYEHGVALLALRVPGPVGVDLVTLPAAWAAAAGAGTPWRQQAALYLGPEHPAAAPHADEACFVAGWAALEAGLKCLEQPLTEWAPALAQRLAGCSVAALQLPAAIAARLPAPMAAAVAWSALD